MPPKPIDDLKETKLQKVFPVDPDTLSEPAIRETISSVDHALTKGFKRIVLSVFHGTITNKISVSRLLLHCQQTVRKKSGRLYLIEHCKPQNSDYQNICSTMNIPIYFDDRRFSEETEMVIN